MKLLLFAVRFFLPVSLVGSLATAVFTSSLPSQSTFVDGFGIDMAAIPAVTIENVEPIILQLENSGVQYIRQEINWNLIETSPDVYDWTAVSQLDLLFTSAKLHNIEVAAILTGGPVYLAQSAQPVDSEALGERWEKFVQAAVDHYGDSVDIWQIGHAPNSRHGLSPFFSPLSPQDEANPDPAYYSDLLRSAAKIINDADPNDQVWLGSLVGVYAGDCAMNPLTFLLEINAARGWKSIDAITYQPAQGSAAPEFAGSNGINSACGSNLMVTPTSLSEEVRAIQELARQLGGKTVIVTGLSWSGDDLNQLAANRDVAVEQVEADLLARASVILMSQNSVPTIFWHTDVTANSASDKAISNLQQALSDVHPLGQLQGDDSSVYDYRFRRGGETTIIAWNSVDGDTAYPAALPAENMRKLNAWAIDSTDLAAEHAMEIEVDDTDKAIVMLNERPIIFKGRTSDLAENMKNSIHDQVELWSEDLRHSLGHVVNDVKGELMVMLDKWFAQVKEDAVDWGEDKLDELLP